MDICPFSPNNLHQIEHQFLRPKENTMIPKKKMINESYKCIWISNHLSIRHLKENPYNDSYML